MAMMTLPPGAASGVRLCVATPAFDAENRVMVVSGMVWLDGGRVSRVVWVPIFSRSGVARASESARLGRWNDAAQIDAYEPKPRDALRLCCVATAAVLLACPLRPLVMLTTALSTRAFCVARGGQYSGQC